ncbi:MAG: serine/threonine protein kinase, partial [Planctomycetes bacterium]|nr:serine/threonine protein kinase [Planctomycetota bacterium]
MTAPAQVGAWVLERELGRGGFGAVYRARHAVHGTPAALKLLLGGVDPDEVLRVEREAQALARLRHPGVVRLLDHGRHPRGWFLVMELVEGESLHERVRRGGPLPAAVAAQLVERLARACAHVHAAGLVHRDIKPENVIVDAGGLPRLIDFGLVRPLDPATPALTATGVLVGTPAFMAPEQVTGGGRAADARADVYGLGGALYFALTGEAPFRGTNPVTVLTALLHQEPDPPAALVRSVPRAISDVCMRALAKAPDARFATSAAMADALADAAGAPRPPSGRE